MILKSLKPVNTTGFCKPLRPSLSLVGELGTIFPIELIERDSLLEVK